MKKSIWVLFALMLLLSGCQQQEKEVLTYGLSKSSFESYYDVYYQIKPVDDTSAVSFRVSPKYEYQTDNAMVNVSIYIEYVFNYELVQEVMSGIINITETDEMIKPLLVGSNHQIVGYTIDQAVGFINTTETITAETHTYTKPFEETDEIKIEDKQNSLLQYQTLVEKLDEQKVIFSNGFKLTQTMDMTLSIGSSVETTTESMTEVYEELSNYYYLSANHNELIVDGNRLYSFEGDYYNLKRLLETEPITAAEFGLQTLHLKEAFEYESQLKNTYLYQRTDDIFKVTAALKDMLDVETYLSLVALYDSLGLDSSLIENSRIFIVFDFTDGFSIETSYSLVYPEQSMVVTSSVLQAFSHEYEKIDPTTDERYVIAHPDTMAEVNQLTDLESTTFQQAPGGIHYYKGYLETGIYEFNISNSYYEYALYNEDGYMLMLTYPEINGVSRYITINQPGYYYVKIDRTEAPVKNDYSFFMYKTVLSDYLNTIDLSTNNTFDFELETETDMIQLVFPYSGYKIINITLDSTAPITIYYEDITGYKAVTVTDSFRHLLKTGLNKLYVKGVSTVNLEYSLENLNHGLYNAYYDVMVPLGTTYLANDFFFGNEPGYVYLRFEVLNAGDYQFFIKGDAGASIFRQEGYSSYSEGMVFNQNIRYLEAGLYYVEFRNDELMSSNIYYLPQK